MKNFTLTFALFLLLGGGLVSTAAAQQIGGIVKDSAGDPVIGASVVVDGTTLGVSSGIDGSWSLDVPDASKKTLVFSYVGMKTQRVEIGSRTRIDVTLEGESTALDDVVVVGYAAVKRRDVVGSVASVSSSASAAAVRSRRTTRRSTSSTASPWRASPTSRLRTSPRSTC